MVWTDEPTDNQITALYSWFKWNLPTDQARAAVNWLRDNSTRHDVSVEMGRVRKLYYEHKLTPETAFESEIWDKFEGAE